MRSRKHVSFLALAAALAPAWAGLQFKAQAQVEIPASAAIPLSKADATKPGFIFNIDKLDASQVDPALYSGFEANSTALTEQALAGFYVFNEADPNATGVASGPGVWLGTAGKSLLQFIIPGTINLDKAAGNNGDFQPEDQMPGVPGTSGTGNGTDATAAEILYWVAIPTASTITFGVNSDDGFRTKAGGVAVKDPFAPVVGEFSGGRGAADTTYQVKFDAPGLYAFRTTFENGTGGENLSMFSEKADGTKVLLNDTANGGLAVYRDITGGTPAYVQAATPGPGDKLFYNTPFSIQIADGSSAKVDKTSVSLKLDGTTAAATVNQAAGVTTIAFTPAPPLTLGSTHTLELIYKDSTGATADKTYSFSVAGNVIPTSFAVTGVDTTKPGFKVKPYQVTSGQPNTMAWTEEMFAGLHGTNIADLTQTINGSPIDAKGYYTVTDPVNWDKEGGADGNFTSNNGYTDATLPGQPSADGNATYANDGEEVLTFVQFAAAGVYTMGVNSDDGFKVTTGPNPKDALQSITLGIFDGGRGASDTLFQFQVAAPGIYPMRLLWENGGSGANCEWFTVQTNGTKILLNDPSATNTSGVKAFYSGPVAPAYVSQFTHNLLGIHLAIQDAGTQVKPNSAQLLLNGAAATTTGGTASGLTTLDYKAPSPFPSGSTQAVTLVYTDNNSKTFTNTASFVNPVYKAITKDTIGGYAGFIEGAGGFTADKGGHSGQAGDFAIDSTAGGGTWVDIQGAGFLDGAAANDTLSVALWVKKYDIVNGSAFWIVGPDQPRAFQSHIPWSDDTIYFDTAGTAATCCDGSLNRINANISTYPSWTDDSFWTNWHHFVYTKKADQKNIYIDGNLFLNGSSTAALSSNLTEIALFTDGTPGGDYMHGLIDDFAIFSTEISAADAKKLATGTAPSALTGETLIAYWNFNDAATVVTGIKITGITAASGNVTIQWTGGGTLQSATTVTGPYTDVTGKTSPATVPATGAAGSFRVKQ